MKKDLDGLRKGKTMLLTSRKFNFLIGILNYLKQIKMDEFSVLEVDSLTTKKPRFKNLKIIILTSKIISTSKEQKLLLTNQFQ